MTQKVVIVTGGNKGIGFAIVKGLCPRFPGDVYLTSRDEAKGKEAIAELNKLGLHPKFHQLDILDKGSIKRLAKFMQDKYGGIDILINNAATGYITKPIPDYEQGKAVMATNFYALLDTCDILLPVMKTGSRVVNLTSCYGHLSNVKNPEIKRRLTKAEMTLKDIKSYVEDYLESLKNGTFNVDDYSENFSDYKVSKIAITLLTFLQHKQLKSRGISVNCVHPGFVKTDLTCNDGVLTWDEGAASSVYLALDAPQNLSGKYIWCDNTEVDWYDTSKEYYLMRDGKIK